jgi:hypothetical protein
VPAPLLIFGLPLKIKEINMRYIFVFLSFMLAVMACCVFFPNILGG